MKSNECCQDKFLKLIKSETAKLPGVKEVNGERKVIDSEEIFYFRIYLNFIFAFIDVSFAADLSHENWFRLGMKILNNLIMPKLNQAKKNAARYQEENRIERITISVSNSSSSD